MKGILVDDDGDLMVRDGSLVIGDCAADVAQRIIVAWTGEFKESPLLGGNAKKMIAGTPDPFWEGNVRSQLKKEKVNVSALRASKDGIELTIED
jgi:hypothetical protein